MNYKNFEFTKGPLNSDTTVSSGDFLLAEPFLAGDEFSRSVVLICEHKNNVGSFGLIVNKASSLQVTDVVDSLLFDNPIYIGGPVEQNTLHFIHTFPEVEDSILLRNGIYWGGNFDYIKLLDVQGQLTTENIRFFMGYSGWGKHQLSGEISEESWVIASTTNLTLLFEEQPKNLWATVLKQMGGKYKLFSNYPTDPRLN